MSKCQNNPINVSIHAPTWGATAKAGELLPVYWFQSTHPHGVRPAKVGELLPVYWFQSTHPHGVRLDLLNNWYQQQVVSIHAPAWGATFLCLSTLMVRLFQSTHPHGVRQEGRIVEVHENMFQSTHPHGVRPILENYRRRYDGFNPRTRMGCDH